MKEKEIYSVENAKVVEKKYRYYDRLTAGFLKEGDSLVHVHVTGIVVDFKSQRIKTSLTDKNTNVIVKEGEFDLFASPKAYEQNDPMTHTCMPTFELLKRADFKHLLECDVNHIEADAENPAYSYLSVWIFENG